MTAEVPRDAPLLAVEGLHKTYGLPGGGRLTAADSVTFTVPAGGSLGIVGESGSGKTTVARMLVGLVRPDAGTVSVSGRTRTPRTPRGRPDSRCPGRPAGPVHAASARLGAARGLGSGGRGEGAGGHGVNALIG